MASVRSWRSRSHRAGYRKVVIVDGPDDVEATAALTPRAVVTCRDRQWVAFDCPCGRGHQQMLPTGAGGWRRDERRGRITLEPSIDDRVHGCHFWLRDGRVRWV